MGYNYNLVGDFLSTEMTYAQHFGGLEVLFGTSAQYMDYERHLQQFNEEEEIKWEKEDSYGWK
jgi:hypothetical protein